MANQMQTIDFVQVADCGVKSADKLVKQEPLEEEWGETYADEDWPEVSVNVADALMVVMKTEDCGDSDSSTAHSRQDYADAAAVGAGVDAARISLGHNKRESPQSDTLNTAGCRPAADSSTELKTDHHTALMTPLYPEYSYTPYLSCNFCDYQCVYKSSLDRHMAIHTGDKPYSCIHCDCKFVQKSNLDIHMRTHTGDKPYPCKHCDRRFAQKSHLDRHMRTHTGDKPYSCKHCNYKFTHKSNLDGHMRTHTGEKPYSCKQCSYKCALKANLERHMHTHTGEKPFSCKQCNYRSAQKASLNRHMKTHTGEKPFSCERCSYKCALKANLDRHMQTHTGEDP